MASNAVHSPPDAHTHIHLPMVSRNRTATTFVASASVRVRSGSLAIARIAMTADSMACRKYEHAYIDVYAYRATGDADR